MAQDLSGLTLSIPPTVDPRIAMRVRESFGRLVKILQAPNADERSKVSARQAMAELRRQADGLGIRIEDTAATLLSPETALSVTIPPMGPGGLAAPKLPPKREALTLPVPTQRVGAVDLPPLGEAGVAGLAVPRLAERFPGRERIVQPSEPIPSARPAAAAVERGPLQGLPAPTESDLNTRPALIAERVPESGIVAPEVPPEEPESPDMAALRAGLAEAGPQPPTGLGGFSQGQRVALAFLAGLRGFQAVAPFIELEQRRQETAFGAAREARRERLTGLTALAEVGERRAERREARRAREAGTSIERARLGLEAERAQQSRERTDAYVAGQTQRNQRLRFGTPPSESLQKDLSDLERVQAALTEVDRLIGEGSIPGGPLTSPFGFAVTPGQREFRAAYQRATTRLRRELFGAAQTITELSGASGFIPQFGQMDSTIRNGLLQIRKDVRTALNSRLSIAAASGVDVRGLSERFPMTKPLVGSAAAPVPPPTGMIPMDDEFEFREAGESGEENF